MKNLFFSAALVALALAAPVQAASTLVDTASGSIGAFSFTNIGITAGTASIAIGIPGTTSQLETVNGAVVPPTLTTVDTPAVLFVTQVSGETYSLSLDRNHIETVGAIPGSQAKMAFSLSAGVAPALLPDFFNASGRIVSLLANANPLYDFSGFANGLGRINLTFTATSFTGTTSFAGLFSTVGATAVGNGSFSQAVVVSEPVSSALMSLGVCSVFGILRLRRMLTA